MNDPLNPPPSSGAGKFAFALLLLLVGGLAYLGYTVLRPTAGNSSGAGPAAPADPTPSTAAPPAPPGAAVTVNIAYGTEKKLWLEWALGEYRKTDAGRRADIRLLGRGSVEGAHEVLAGPGNSPIHVWSPASSAYRGVFESEWRLRHGGGSPILRAEDLALTPMVFVMWRERFDALRTKHPQLNFTTVASAMQEPGGWGTLANQPDWGLFKFGHTHPNKSNSGLMTLVLMAYDFHQKQRGLTVADATGAPFQQWLADFARGVARPAGELSHSTGTLMRDMVLRGPSSFDCLFVYENLAIDYLRAAAGRWGELVVVYPQRNIWNENPYYILDVPWSSAEQRRAAADFLDFLTSEPIQRQAVQHGFRPGNPAVAIKFPGSPFEQFTSHGIQIDIPTVCEPPPADALTNLLASFQRLDR